MKDKKIERKLTDIFRSLPTRMILIILLVILPFNALAIALSTTSVNTMIRQAEISVQNVMENYMTNLQSQMESTEYLLWNMKNKNADGQIMFRQETDYKYDAARIRFYYQLLDAVRLAGGADSYFFYMSTLEDILLCNDDMKMDSEIQKDFLRDKIQNGYQRGWSLDEIDGRPVSCLFIQLNDIIYGGWIYLDEVLESIRKDIQYTQTEFSFSAEPFPDSSSAFLTVTVDSARSEIFLNGIIQKDEIIAHIDLIYRVMQIGAVVALIVIPLLYLLIKRQLLDPLGVLNAAHRQLRKGNLDYRIETKANSSEYEYSYLSFNEMAGDIQKLKIENYEKELARQRMELKNLQLQIHPHFLLNTFNLVYTLTQRGGEKNIAEVQNIVMYLTDYFRYLFRSGRQMELFSKEQHLIEGYLHMASVRYPNCIDIEYDYDPEIYFARVPPLLIHNFVENIIKHAVKQGVVTHISIVGQYGDGVVTFMIMDDGPGMDEETLKDLMASMRDEREDNSHVGYKNSLRRMKYFYGNDADIQISSEPENGTCVTISFPYNLEVDDDLIDRE